MDPDLMAEYAKMGMLSRRDSQFVDGLSVDFVVKRGKDTFKQHTALYKRDDTLWSFPAQGFEGVEEFAIKAYMEVSFQEITLLAKLSSGEEAILLHEDHAKPKKTYEAKTVVNGETYEVKLSTK